MSSTNMRDEERARLKETRLLLLGHVANLPQPEQVKVLQRIDHLKLRAKKDGPGGMLALSIAVIELQVGIL